MLPKSTNEDRIKVSACDGFIYTNTDREMRGPNSVSKMHNGRKTLPYTIGSFHLSNKQDCQPSTSRLEWWMLRFYARQTDLIRICRSSGMRNRDEALKNLQRLMVPSCSIVDNECPADKLTDLCYPLLCCLIPTPSCKYVHMCVDMPLRDCRMHSHTKTLFVAWEPNMLSDRHCRHAATRKNLKTKSQSPLGHSSP